jgi:hypothetical protein
VFSSQALWPQNQAGGTDWNFTFADLMAEMKAGKRDSVGQPELDWVRDYERSLIPAAARECSCKDCAY